MSGVDAASLTSQTERNPRGTGDGWEAASNLLDRCGGALLEQARRCSLCVEDAEDAYQRAVEKLLTRAPEMSRFQMYRWMETTVRHEALTLRRQRQRVLNDPAGGGPDAGRFAETDWVSLLPSPGPGPEERYETREKVSRAHEALRGIKRDERRALGLLGEGYSYAEIQELTGWTYTKVNRCVAEGRKRFRELFTRSETGDRCAELSPALSRFSDGELAAAEIAELRAHLRSCATCRATLASYRGAPRAAAALLPTAPAGGLLERLQELAASAHARLADRPALGEALVAQAAGGGGSRGGGMAVLAKLAVVCAGAGGGAAACVATGAVPTPILGETERPARVAERDAGAAEAAGEPAPAEAAPPAPVESAPGAATGGEGDREETGTAGESAPRTRPVPRPTAPEREFTPEAAGTPILAGSGGGGSGGGATASSSGGGSSQPATSSTTYSSESGSGDGTDGDGSSESVPPVGGGGEFGP